MYCSICKVSLVCIAVEHLPVAVAQVLRQLRSMPEQLCEVRMVVRQRRTNATRRILSQSEQCKVSLLCSALHARCPFYAVVYTQSVPIVYFFYAKCPCCYFCYCLLMSAVHTGQRAAAGLLRRGRRGCQDTLRCVLSAAIPDLDTSVVLGLGFIYVRTCSSTCAS